MYLQKNFKSVPDDLGLETLKCKEAMDKGSLGLSVKIPSLPHTPPLTPDPSSISPSLLF